ncbi:MAG: cob(I)yrinic acid a,c-diamide adenosyltransferase [Flavobacteriales bacterium]|jgi:cob(I)alamin adenosyltransferase|nr:cob(I)yrinic acid a,c-diamide adenosyltransferase [Flavobacteriales bacterium]MBT5932733.1 cob(I)yrinic acid a,c-diamide adenosyltransferase [Flavobacteriales bacterium]MDA7762064.1 cob(I)yrinic acid a,c-diamide adenosyltransferase [Crocinitomicaceae bacterium]MDO7612957.1 cob(I)yrinic acid a,c-diamide adenosyltransferase [Crocinitomicaceae bacterium]
MKIYTKKGDEGKTGLIGGTRVSKNDLKINAYGTVDELNAFVGMLRDSIGNTKYTSQLIEIQDRLFTAGSLLAVSDSGSSMKIPMIEKNDIVELEEWIDEMDTKLPEMKSFVLPGGHQTVSYCHITRTICRRAERCIVTLSEHTVVDPIILAYFNRLSDYLFTLGRSMAQELNIKETPWNPKL